MLERPGQPTKSIVPTIPEYVDDASVRYALDGAVAWSAMALSRALVEERRGVGDARFDRLRAIQRELTELRDEWGESEAG